MNGVCDFSWVRDSRTNAASSGGGLTKQLGHTKKTFGLLMGGPILGMEVHWDTVDLLGDDTH